MTKEIKTIPIKAALFDLDGTIVNSTDAVTEFWKDFVKDKPTVDLESILRICHGVRSVDIISQYASEYHVDIEEHTRLEGEIPIKYGTKAKAVPGSVELINQIEAVSKDGKQRWCIVTSGNIPLATRWLKRLKLQEPKVFITAEKVGRGKPDPSGYIMGRELMGYSRADKTVVFEDAPAGIRAGKKAGSLVVGILSSYNVEVLKSAGADVIVRDLTGIRVESDGSGDMLLKVADYEYYK